MTHVGHESQTRAWRSQTYHWYYPPRTYGMPCSTFKNISKSFSLHEFTVPLFPRKPTLNSRQRDRHHAHHCASEISPRALQGGRCRLEHSICRDAEVPSSTQSAPLSPIGINKDAHRTDSRIPLGPRSPSSRAPDMYGMLMPNIPNGRETSRRIPLPPWPGY